MSIGMIFQWKESSSDLLASRGRCNVPSSVPFDTMLQRLGSDTHILQELLLGLTILYQLG